MNQHFVDIYFYGLAGLLFGTVAFYPRVMDNISKRSIFRMSRTQLQLLRRFNAFLCAACVCMLLLNLWKIVR